MCIRDSLAETERRERGEDLPQPLDELRGVAVAQRSRDEPAPYGLLPLGVDKRAPRLVALRHAAAGGDGNELDDLLVEDHYAAGLGEHRLDVEIRVVRLLPALP